MTDPSRLPATEPAAEPDAASAAPPPVLDAVQIARFLQQQPDFFLQHASVFANLRVPHPHAPSTISLGERQVMTLRAKAKALEQTLAQLMHNAAGNERISTSLLQWAIRLLAENDAERLPQTIVSSVQEVFALQTVTLKLWGLPALNNSEYALNLDVRAEADLPRLAQTLAVPTCGTPQNFGTLQSAAGGQWAAWLAECFETPPASLALVALREPQTQKGNEQGDADAFGLLLLGSDNDQRFTADMQTTFLTALGQLASAALGRLNRLHQPS